MKEQAFQELITSIREAGGIHRGKLKPARITTFRPARKEHPREAQDVADRIRADDRRQCGDVT